jgi:hypothetical protein
MSNANGIARRTDTIHTMKTAIPTIGALYAAET